MKSELSSDESLPSLVDIPESSSSRYSLINAEMSDENFDLDDDFESEKDMGIIVKIESLANEIPLAEAIAAEPRSSYGSQLGDSRRVKQLERELGQTCAMVCPHV